MTRLALFGGTFDPPHVGHFIAAWDVLEALDLDTLWFVPSGEPPHKLDRCITPGRLRLRMIEAGLEAGGGGAAASGGASATGEASRAGEASPASESRVAVSDIELLREGPSSTVDTLRSLRRERPHAEIHFVLGTDQFADFASWKEPDEIVRLARLVVVGRGGALPEAVGRPEPAARPQSAAPPEADSAIDVPFERVEVTRIDVSSSEIRRRVREGRSIRYLVPEPVRRIIESEGLYEKG